MQLFVVFVKSQVYKNNNSQSITALEDEIIRGFEEIEPEIKANYVFYQI